MTNTAALLEDTVLDDLTMVIGGNKVTIWIEDGELCVHADKRATVGLAIHPVSCGDVRISTRRT